MGAEMRFGNDSLPEPQTREQKYTTREALVYALALLDRSSRVKVNGISGLQIAGYSLSAETGSTRRFDDLWDYKPSQG